MMKRRNIFIILLLLCISLLIGLIGCERKKEKPEGAYSVYYLKQSGTELTQDYYVVQAEEPENIVTELWNQFISVPEGEDNISAFPPNISLLGVKIEDRVLVFDSQQRI